MPSLVFEVRDWWASPYINHFLSADTIVAGITNPQNLNRFSYVLNNPIRYIDPTGHMMTSYDGGGGGSICNTFADNCNSSSPNNNASGEYNSLACSLNNNGNHGGNDEDSANAGCTSLICMLSNGSANTSNDGIPDPLFQQLVNAGVSENLLNSVTLVVYDQAPFWVTSCWDNNAAFASGNTITFCSSQFFDPDNVNPYLVHELVHVHQSQQDPLFSIKYWWQDVTQGYQNNSYEQEAYACGDPIWQTYNAGQPLPPLNVTPCNLP